MKCSDIFVKLFQYMFISISVYSGGRGKLVFLWWVYITINVVMSIFLDAHFWYSWGILDFIDYIIHTDEAYWLEN
jgi:hypothetical protein